MGESIVRILPRRCVLLMMTTLFLLHTIEPYSAQELWSIPPSVTSKFVNSIRESFCDGCPTVRTQCAQPIALCQWACQVENCGLQCEENKDLSKETTISCGDSQETLCGFKDALICQYTDMSGVCVFEETVESAALCICESQPGAEDDYTYQLRADSCNEEDRQPKDSNGGRINIAIPILISVLTVVLAVLCAMAAKLYRRRNGNSPALLNNKTPNATKGSSVELESNASKRVSTPLPLVPGENPQADFHTYYSLEFDDKGEGSTRYVVHGQNSTPSEADKVPSTEDAIHDYSVLEKTHSTENIGMSDPDCTTSPTESLPESPVETESIHSPELSPAESETPLDRSGYEIAVVAPRKENICSPVHKPAESETTNNQSGYEVAVVSTPPADANDSSLYDHFDRSTSQLSKVCDFSVQENSDYQQLEKV